jgi:5-methylcytosine-specific restriction endonuclease McrA
VAEYDASARSPSTQIRLPSVVALRKYQRPPRRVTFTRFNVFLRDRFTCQYCCQAFAASALTFEHVVPRSHGGQTTWSNIVTACVPCNTGKGNSLRIKPRRLPKQPTVKKLMAARCAFPPGYLHEGWVDYLYWDAQLES